MLHQCQQGLMTPLGNQIRGGEVPDEQVSCVPVNSYPQAVPIQKTMVNIT
ncbi:MAG: hypothetical protein ACYS1A_11035 [Planctomycetota bacterium]